MEPSKAIESWVEQQTKTGPVRMFAALGCLLAGAAVLFLTFWFVYGVIYISLDWIVPHSHEFRLWLSFAVVALLFVFNATTDRRSLEDYRLTTDDLDDRPVVLTIPLLMVSGSMINPLTFGSMRSFTRGLAIYRCSSDSIVTALLWTTSTAIRVTVRSIDTKAEIVVPIRVKGEVVGVSWTSIATLLRRSRPTTGNWWSTAHDWSTYLEKTT